MGAGGAGRPANLPPGRPGVDSRRSEPRPSPRVEVVRTRGGGEIHRDPRGVVREVRTPTGAIIHHSPSGVRMVERRRPDGSMVVANATGRAGYVQRPIVVHNTTYVQRTYIINGAATTRVYRPYVYGGVTYQVYTPAYYYQPAYYTWGYTPWDRPVVYQWGWESRPWYGHYGGYFTPYPTYVSPSFWLADFMVATTLESAYLAQREQSIERRERELDRERERERDRDRDRELAAPAPQAMSPEIKQLIADEVRRQLEQEKADQAAYRAGAPPAEKPALFAENGPKVFLVSENLFAYSGERDCPLIQGDVLRLTRVPRPGEDEAEVEKLSSLSQSCGQGNLVTVKVADLQEMHNHMRATLDQGMSKLQEGQGRNGIPSLTAAEMGTSPTSLAGAVRPDTSAAAQITEAAHEANLEEKGIIAQGAEAGTGGTVTLGMSPREVEGILGRPRSTVDLPNKQIYVYKDLKVTFLDGKVSDVQ